MELQCDACQAVMQIPEERVPVNTTFRVTCPRCKRKIVASSKPSETETETDRVALHDSLPMETTAPEGEVLEKFSAETIDTLQPGQHISLLCLDQGGDRSSLTSLIEGMGYTVDCPLTTEHALQRLRFNQYHLIVLSDTFGGQAPNPVSCYLANLNMSTRRDIFIVLLGERFKTADQWQAFAESVNLVCHPADLPQFPALLKRALSEHERLYRVFNECLIAAGKKI
jgi:predicted Zn finger-like uncharacterized protein